MRRSWAYGVAWAAVLLMGAAVLPAALLDCHGEATAAPEDPQAADHCAIAQAAARSLDCCLPVRSAGDEGEAPASSMPELPVCCVEAAEEPASLPPAAGLHGETAPAVGALRLAASAIPAPAAGPPARPGPEVAAPPADLCILHASFLI